MTGWFIKPQQHLKIAEACEDAAPQGLTDERIRAKTLDSMLARIDGLLCDRMKSDPHGTLDMALETARNVRALLREAGSGK